MRHNNSFKPKPLLSLAIALSSFMALTVQAAQVTPGAILTQVKKEGAARAVAELWKREDEVKQVLKGIGSGNSEWLDVAVSLKAEADGEASESLDDALAMALLKVPYRVLPILKQLWWAQNDAQICSFDYDSELPGGVAEYVNQLENAILYSAAGQQATLREACLNGIAETKGRIVRAPR
jgi:hypothetical protein